MSNSTIYFYDTKRKKLINTETFSESATDNQDRNALVYYEALVKANYSLNYNVGMVVTPNGVEIWALTATIVYREKKRGARVPFSNTTYFSGNGEIKEPDVDFFKEFLRKSDISFQSQIMKWEFENKKKLIY